MTGTRGLHEVETVFLLLLVLVAVFAIIARRIQIPYPIVLVVAGLAISFVPGLPRISLDPNVVFLVILPPLLYSGAWLTSWREFRFNLVSIALLAVGLVAFTVWGVATFADRFIPGLGWKEGFLLGAVVSPTDAIAATSIARRLGLPRGITDVLEGESLVNDATGLLALEFGVMMLVEGHTPTVGAGLLRMLWLIVGGCGIGLMIGVVAAWFERWVDDAPVEIVLSLVVPYVTYLAADGAKASGVLAVVACGLYMSRKSAVFFFGEDAYTGEFSVAVVDVRSERDCICADWIATAVCGGGDTRPGGEGADCVWRGLQRGADCAAAGVDVSGSRAGVPDTEASVEAEAEPAWREGGVCTWVDGDARGGGAGGGDLVAGDAGERAAVCG